MKARKYKLGNPHPTLPGLFRVVALREIRDNLKNVIVKKGDVGGYVESEANLSQSGTCWIFDNAVAEGQAVVRGDAKLYYNAHVLDRADVSGNVSMSGFSTVRDDAVVTNGARLCDTALISESAGVFGDVTVSGNVRVFGNAVVSGYAFLSDRAKVGGTARVDGQSRLSRDVQVRGNAVVTDLHLRCGILSRVPTMLDMLRCSFGVHSVNGEVTLYKRVRADLSSEHDRTFKYPREGYVEFHGYDPDPKIACAAGGHFSTNEYWPDGGADYPTCVLVARVKVSDIICCLESKVRVKAAYIVGVADTD